MKDRKLKQEKILKSKETRKGGESKQVKPKGNNKNTPNENNYDKYAWKKVPPKEGEKEKKTINGKTYHC